MRINDKSAARSLADALQRAYIATHGHPFRDGEPVGPQDRPPDDPNAAPASEGADDQAAASPPLDGELPGQ